ncbi:2OG-Fe(II) oxygenase [Myxococcus sp. CA051A]|uniref:2OG-Fe(II) oxygenase n=1 Tax=Myxococcus sp. CA051A TaxID=2741739 RepID=UPI00157B0B9E|nr:2OG-Fe(II) oxygenase [Myxococcus sp. CA051A]
MRPYITHRQALPPVELESLRDALLGSRFVARSPLMGTFQASRGFAFIFTHEGRSTLEARFPFLRAYLARVLAPESARGLRPWRERLFGSRQPMPNAFYLNLLLLDAGKGVGRHIDATLQGPSGVPEATPRHVSVLYLQMPAGARGGALRLLHDNRDVGEVRPRPGLLVHFQGHLQHEVQPFLGARDDSQRASLVCEQYVFAPDALARLPPFRIQSKAGFAAYLDAQRERTDTGNT